MNEEKLVQPTNCLCGSAKTEGPTLIFACSGAADLGGVSDQAARKLSAEGTGKMFCLAAIGGGIQAYSPYRPRPCERQNRNHARGN